MKRFMAGVAFLMVPLSLLAAPITNLYVIGDSLSDQGNLFAATEQLRGRGIPAADHYSNGRFANGRNYVDFLAEKYGLEVRPSSAGGTNFAYGGARTTYNREEQDETKPLPVNQGGTLPKGAFPWTLELQAEAFKARNFHDPDALYIVFSGANDVGDLIGPTLRGQINPAGFISGAVAGVQKVIQAYRDAGARQVIVPNIPDLALVPLISSQNPPGSTVVSDTATALVRSYNAALDQMLDGFSDIEIIRFDTFALLDKVVADPGKYGFENVTEPCYSGFVAPDDGTQSVCDFPAKYLFWDVEHPTEAFHRVLADQLIKTIPEPGILLLILIGTVSVAIFQKKSGRK